jgi:hypothetical protein
VDPIDQSFWVSHEYADSSVNTFPTTRFWRTLWSNVTLPKNAEGWPGAGRLVRGPLTTAEDARAIADGAGGAIVAWRDKRDETHYIYASRLLSNGARADGWRYNGALLSGSPGRDWAAPQIVSDGAGGAYVAFGPADTPNSVRIQRVSAAGAIAPGWPVDGVEVATNGLGVAPHIAGSGDGGVLVAWAGGGIRVQKVNAAGAKLWGTNGVSVQATGGLPNVCDDGAGGAFVSFSSSTVRVQRVNAAGVPQWVSPTSIGTGTAPRTCRDGASGVYVAFQRTDGGGTRDLYVSRVTSSGAIASGWPATGLAVAVATGEQTEHVVTPDGAGGLLVTWSDARTGPIQDVRDIRLQRLTAAGAPVSGWPADGVAVCAEPGTQIAPALVADGQGGAVVSWQDRRADPSCINSCADDVYIRHVLASGAFDPGYPSGGRALSALPGVQGKPSIAIVSPAYAIATWEDGRHVPDCVPFCPTAIYAQRLAFDTTAPTSAPQSALSSTLRFHRPQPNPATRSTWFSWEIPASLEGARSSLALFDVSGRRRRTLHSASARAGNAGVRWDLNDDHGVRIPSGVYFAELRAGDERRVLTVVVP